ncbi:hypothetical protein PYCC9005_002433 [Savitreella phatthalungensis]
MTDHEPNDPPYSHVIAAGTLGGSVGDLLMHSLDTVKTRQQGAPGVSKYFHMGSAYRTILREEGVLRGLYGGVTPAMLGSLPGTAIFFATYECSKRNLIALGLPETLTHLTSGLLGDLLASVIYVPSEVLKTRLQLQGKYDNAHFQSGYNYRGTIDAVRTIYRREGASALFHGYKATIVRDLPYSALTFAFYERFKVWARRIRDSHDMGLDAEILTGSAAGALGGAITTPLDVVKTRIQTQQTTSSTIYSPVAGPSNDVLSRSMRKNVSPLPAHTRLISTSAPIAFVATQQLHLSTDSVIEGLRQIHRREGVMGLFRGIGPRTAWTGAQSSIMFVIYENVLRLIGPRRGPDDRDSKSAQ